MKPAARILLTVALAACSTPNVTPGGAPTSLQTKAARQTAAAADLFVENYNDITEYSSTGKLVRTITKAIPKKGMNAGGIAFDSQGYLYAITGLTSVAVYAPSSRKLARSLTSGIAWPISIDVDSHDNLYVGNEQNDTVSVFPSGQSEPARTISKGIKDPVALAFDSAGDLYVANLFGNSVTVYSPSGKLMRSITQGIRGPQAIVLDANDQLFVGNTHFGNGRTVTVYSAGGDTPIATIERGIHGPAWLALTSSSQLWVSDENDASATLYSGAGWNLAQTIADISLPGPVLVDSKNDLYVECCAPQINVYPAGSDKPSLTITQGITSVRAMALGPP
ncbi:MAG: hypothetical protein JOZ77_10840 [Candidatus Eremiobacteraeota bacterium]|nr:hypothetical protein [Candidatus Eremiobacteraeota bacterium]